jgi:ATP-dependent protease HslVU (ClpYQ) peptidase subunit
MIIAAYISNDESRVYMASDSMSTHGEIHVNSNILAYPEKHSRMLIGIYGYPQAVQSIEMSVIMVPDKSGRRNMLEFITNQIIPQIDRFQGHKDFFFDMLIAFDMRIFHMRKDYSLTELQGNYNAIGIGRDYVIGALCALENVPMFSASDKLTIAIESANKNNVSSGKISIDYI